MGGSARGDFDRRLCLSNYRHWRRQQLGGITRSTFYTLVN
jgi:hypothetical protein